MPCATSAARWREASTTSGGVGAATFCSAVRVKVTGAIRSGFFQIGCPSLRQYSAKAQRGSVSPGYHLPWP